MKTPVLVLLLLVCLVPALARGSQPEITGAVEPSPPSWIQQSNQLIVVTSSDWTSNNGTLRWYGRAPDKAWRQIAGPFPVSLGKGGLGWGLGLHSADAAMQNEPVKIEGDGKSPVGVFTLSYAFAYHPEQIAGTDMPVLDVEPDLFCVDDPESAQYNTTQRLQANLSAPWKSAEEMQRKDDVYKLGIFVAHNQDPPLPGRGSCIFLHIVKRDGSPTSGCTAMGEGTIKELIQWLNPAAFPILAQLPEPVYVRFQRAWGLP